MKYWQMKLIALTDDMEPSVYQCYAFTNQLAAEKTTERHNQLFIGRFVHTLAVLESPA